MRTLRLTHWLSAFSDEDDEDSSYTGAEIQLGEIGDSYCKGKAISLIALDYHLTTTGRDGDLNGEIFDGMFEGGSIMETKKS